MASLYWANLINFYQPPNCDRAELEQIVNKSYIPLLRIFSQNPKISVSINIPGSTVDLLIRTGFGNQIKKIAELADKGQIEFTLSPRYHPVIPIVADDDVDRQIEGTIKICKRYFGINYNPQGLYSPFLAYTPKVSKAAARFGMKWVAIDESSIPGSGQSDGQDRYANLYMDKSAGGVLLMPRHRELSDQLEGNIWARKVPRTSNEFVQNAMRGPGNDKYFITMVEAEHFGFVTPGRYNLLRSVYGEPKLRAVTVSDLRQHLKRKEFIKPLESSIAVKQNNNRKKNPFLLWQDDGNPLQQMLWQLFNMAVAEIKNAGSKGDPQYTRAREMMDSAAAGINWSMLSCSPYWNGCYAMRAADDLALAVFVVITSPLKVKENAIALRTKIYEQIEQFEKNGEPRKQQKNYFRQMNIPLDRAFGKSNDRE